MATTGVLDSWVYVSASLLSGAAATNAVADIVRVSRGRNAALDVTGALIFTGERFAQFLEGPAENIEVLKASISADSRHHLVTTISTGPPVRRQFAGWALVYSGDSRYMANLIHGVELGNDVQTLSARATILKVFEAFANGPRPSP